MSMVTRRFRTYLSMAAKDIGSDGFPVEWSGPFQVVASPEQQKLSD
jgi:hypothetical protein